MPGDGVSGAGRWRSLFHRDASPDSAEVGRVRDPTLAIRNRWAS
ncbi:hypothetical protein I545_4958 [Mycobacterium kansasii 662]|uniref:Uncharacterized protein n=1 Tax=Mycobacterium kansasii 662 TaxID=1299326 RepID=X7YZT2_MYCKA|nr:hypothetical protein I545_4958 [Mycobacterium kansasii 662]